MLTEYETPLDPPVINETDTLYQLIAQRAFQYPYDAVAEYRLEKDDPEPFQHDSIPYDDNPNNRRLHEDGLKGWVVITAAQMLHDIRRAAKGLIALGIRKGDAIMIYASTRYQWAVIDYACAAVGAISVPIYETDSYAQTAEIALRTHAAMGFADTTERLAILEKIAAETEDNILHHVLSLSVTGLQILDKSGLDVDEQQLDNRINEVHADDVATIVFTSGSTGAPKGAQLTHRNMLYPAYAGWEVLPHMTADPSRLLLFLPLAHVFARFAQNLALGSRGVVAFIPNARHLLSDLRDFQPTYIFGVPRVYEKIHNAASQKAGSGFKGRLFIKARAHFEQWSQDEQNGIDHTVKQKIQHHFYDCTVGAIIRDALGSNINGLACGGAPMDVNLAHFFNGIDGISFVQGYGMTETAAPCCVNFQEANRIGTVGKPGPGTKIRLSDDGELEVNGPGVFVGYLNDPEKTEETFTDDGWLRSGDFASIDDDGFVSITGRKKNLLITAGGKNVVPEPAEEMITSCPIVSHTLLVGDAQPFVAAIVTLDPEMLSVWYEKNHLLPQSLTEAAMNTAVKDYIQEYIDRANSAVSRAESVRKFIIRPNDFSQEEGTLTPSLKIARPKAVLVCSDLIEHEIYGSIPMKKNKETTNQK